MGRWGSPEAYSLHVVWNDWRIEKNGRESPKAHGRSAPRAFSLIPLRYVASDVWMTARPRVLGVPLQQHNCGPSARPRFNPTAEPQARTSQRATGRTCKISDATAGPAPLPRWQIYSDGWAGKINTTEMTESSPAICAIMHTLRLITATPANNLFLF